MPSRRNFIKTAGTGVALSVGLSGCAGNGAEDDAGGGGSGSDTTTGTTTTSNELADSLRVANYGGAMGQAIEAQLLDGFAEEYDVEIVSGDFPSNWGLISQLQSGGLDIDVLMLDNTAVPSAYAADLMTEIRPENVPNLDRYLDRFDPTSAQYDPTEDGISYAPFQYYADGLTYNTEELSSAPTSWDDVLTEEVRGNAINASWIDRVIGVAGSDIGVDVANLREDTQSKLEQIWSRVEEQNEYIFEWAGTGAAIQSAFANGQAHIGMLWYGRATTLRDRDDVPVDYIIPDDGTTMATSGWAISADSDRQYTAEKFIDYCLSEQAQYNYSDAIGYVPPTEMSELPSIVQDNPDYQQRDQLEFFDGRALMDNQSDWSQEFQQVIRQ